MKRLIEKGISTTRNTGEEKYKSFLFGVEKTKKIIRDKFKRFIDRNGEEPYCVNCRIVWKDTNDYHDVKIQLSADVDNEDDDIFFYCDSLDDLLSLVDFGGEDFVVTECFEFEISRTKK